jgi:hypothetical protein
MRIKDKNIQVGDFFSFKTLDGTYRVIFCIETQVAKSPFYYWFAATTINTTYRPTKQDIMECGFYGIVNRKKFYFKTVKNAESIMWKDDFPELNPFIVGVFHLTINRKDLLKFQEDFEFIENLPIHEKLHMTGNSGMNASSQESLNKLFLSDIDKYMGIQGQKSIVLTCILKNKEDHKEESEDTGNFWSKLKSFWQ